MNFFQVVRWLRVYRILFHGKAPIFILVRSHSLSKEKSALVGVSSKLSFKLSFHELCHCIIFSLRFCAIFKMHALFYHSFQIVRDLEKIVEV